MIPTKTYPLSAIMGEETDEYERGYAQGFEEGKERIAELEAEVKVLTKYTREIEIEYSQSDEKVKSLREALSAMCEATMSLSDRWKLRDKTLAAREGK